MSAHTVIPATIEHVWALAPRLREIERLELQALGCETPLEAMLFSLSVSPYTRAWLVNGVVMCVWGLAAPSMIGRVGSPWLLTCDLVDSHKLAFLRKSRRIIADMLQQFPILGYYVDARHVVCVQWLRWLGFTVHAAVPFGPHSMPFHPFEKRAATCQQ